MIQENFDDFNESWARDLLPGVARVVDLNEEEAVKHPYNEKNFLRLFEEGWETRKPGCYT
ncbi:TPA: hypothetical protein EYO63_20320 [Candidatus Poribacteria bacterium]|nr:hypothetical protein [Candidatus Poribacteria bacterium]